MAATIRDVAMITGVSPSTVSRVINNKGVISQETQARVFKAMRELDYHPNSLAQSFAKGKAGAVLLVMDVSAQNEYSNTYFLQTIFAIETVLQENSFSLIISCERENEQGASIMQMIHSKRADGLILPPRAVGISLLESLRKNETPFVVLGQPKLGHQPYSWVDVDNELGARQAVEHLAGQGYGRIAFVGANREAVFMSKRFLGYSSALVEYGLQSNESWQLDFSQDTEMYYQTIEGLLRREEAPDAFICSDNVIAFHTLQAAKKAGRRIPQDIGILTFDNYPLAEYTDPPLSSVNVDTFKMGQYAAQNLMKQIQTKSVEPRSSLLPTGLNVRLSTHKNTK